MNLLAGWNTFCKGPQTGLMCQIPVFLKQALSIGAFPS